MNRTRPAAASAIAAPRPLAVFMLVAGVVGFVAAFELTRDKIDLLAHPGLRLSCNISVLVGCSKDLSSWQGSLLGFPNSLLGIGAWSVIIVVGLLSLSGTPLPRWFWIGLVAGLAAGLALVVFLLSQSIFSLGVLCPWCMTTWAVTIPLFLGVAFFAVGTGIVPGPPAVRRAATAAAGWVPLISLGCYIVIAALAQLQLNVLQTL